MADSKISQLTDGGKVQVTDQVPVSRGGENRRVQVGALAALDSLSKADVGLGNVNNTSDASKPVSTATQTALNLKANLASPTFTGTVSGISKNMVGLANVDNTSDANKPISTATQTALNAKEPANAFLAKLNVAQQFTKQHSFLETTLASGVPINWDLDNNQNASIILTSNSYLLPVNIKNGADYTLTVKQDAVGSRVILFSNLSFKFPSGGIPVLSTTPNATDVLKFTASNGVLLVTSFDKNFISESNPISSRSPAFWINGENVIMSGSNVTQVNDMGTLGYNLTAGSGNTTISNINGLPALDFGTTVKTNMQRTGVLASDISTLNAMTIFIVQKILATGSQNWAFNWDSTSGLTPSNDILIGSPDAVAGAQRARWLYGNFSNATDSLLADVTNINVNPKVLCFLKRSNNLGSIYENNNLVLSGTMNGTVTLTDSGTLSVGAGESFSGQFKGLIAEVIVFKTTLLSADIAAVNQYLQNKYNIF